MRDLLSGTIPFVVLLAIAAGGQTPTTTQAAQINNAAFLERLNFLESRVVALETQVRLLQDQSTRSPVSSPESESTRWDVPFVVSAAHRRELMAADDGHEYVVKFQGNVLDCFDCRGGHKLC